jgi:hypothetical protein
VVVMNNRRRRIGVLTFHRCINYGSYWQARCLVDVLRERKHDAVLLDHYSWKVNFAEWKCALQPVLPTPIPATDYPLYRRKIRKFFDAFASLPCSPCFPLENPAEMGSYDLVVVGSDEVWNLRHPWYGGCSLFFGHNVRAARLISYAASFGNYPASYGLERWWAERLHNFDLISVRDENTQIMIKAALGVEPELTLDPCLLSPPRPEGQWYEPQWAREPYVAVYGHNFSRWFSREIRYWARLRGYRLISIGYRNDWADEQWITAGPDDFLHFMAHAQAVATNFFHGCVFSLCNEKPFVCEISSYRSIKIENLMVAVQGEQHMVSNSTPATVYETRLSQPLEAAILQRITCLRQQSEAYLDRVLA